MTAVTPGREELLANKLCAEFREIERSAEADAALSDSGRERIISDCHASIRGVRALAARLAAKPDDEGVREADGSTDEKALVLVMNVLQRIADTALAGFKEDGIDESSALSSINNITRDAIDALAKRRLSTTGEPKR